MLNRYFKRSRISEATFRYMFANDLTAVQIAKLSGVSGVSVNNIIKALRIRIAELCQEQSPFDGNIEVDESYFGPRRIRDKRGRGASGKTIVVGVFKRNGCV